MRPTRFLESFHYLPDPRWMGSIMAVPRAGMVAAGSGYRVERMRLQGHDILYCTEGAGRVRIGEAEHGVVAGQLVWLPGHLPHGHAADPADPWTVMWLRLDGPGVEACRARLLGAQGGPVTVARGAVLGAWFQRLFACLQRRAPDSDLLLNALAAELLVLIDAELRGTPDRSLPAPLARLTAAMGARPGHRWTEDEIRALSHVSAAHLRRLFRTHLQTTPRAWLRRERIMLAQDLLLRPGARVSAVADACGFGDIYHFSRDFRRAVGQSPSHWRRSEAGLP